MEFHVRIHHDADLEIESAMGFIARDSPTRAVAWFYGLMDAIQSLKRFPHRCALAPEAAAFKREIRQLLYGIYRILFVVEASTITVLHIRHGARTSLQPE